MRPTMKVLRSAFMRKFVRVATESKDTNFHLKAELQTRSEERVQ